MPTVGCIVFSQYFDTAYWVAASLTAALTVALYAGADKSGMSFAGEWRSEERENLKKAGRDRMI